MDKRHFINIPIDPKLRKAIRLLSIQKNTTMTELIIRTMQQLVQQEQKQGGR